MFKINDIHRNAAAALGAMLVSFALVGASIGPVHLGTAAIAATASVR